MLETDLAPSAVRHQEEDTDDESPPPARRASPPLESERILTGAEFADQYRALTSRRSGALPQAPRSPGEPSSLLHHSSLGPATARPAGQTKRRSAGYAHRTAMATSVYANATNSLRPPTVAAAAAMTEAHLSAMATPPATRPSGRKSSTGYRSRLAAKSGAAAEATATESTACESFLTRFENKIRRRCIPERGIQDPEELYMELIALKQQMTEQQLLQRKQLAEVAKLTDAKARAEKKVEELLKASTVLAGESAAARGKLTEGNIVRGLRAKVNSLEATLATTNEELQKLRLDGRYLRVRELEMEVKAYFSEARRLQRILDQLTTSRNKDAEQQAMHEALQLLTQKDNDALRLRDTIASQKSEIRRLQEEAQQVKERATHELQDARAQIEELQAENQDLNQLAEARLAEVHRLTDRLRMAQLLERERAAENEKLVEAKRKVEQDFEDLARDHAEISKAHQSCPSEKAELTENLAAANSDLAEKVEKFKLLEQQFAEASKASDEKSAEIEQLRRDVKVHKEHAAALSDERTEIAKEHAECAGILGKEREIVAELRMNIQQQASTAEADKAKLKEEVQRLEDNLAAEYEDKDKLLAQLAQMEAKCKRLQSDIAAVAKERDYLASRTTMDQAEIDHLRASLKYAAQQETHQEPKKPLLAPAPPIPRQPSETLKEAEPQIDAHTAPLPPVSNSSGSRAPTPERRDEYSASDAEPSHKAPAAAETRHDETATDTLSLLSEEKPKAPAPPSKTTTTAKRPEPEDDDSVSLPGSALDPTKSSASSAARLEEHKHTTEKPLPGRSRSRSRSSRSRSPRSRSKSRSRSRSHSRSRSRSPSLADDTDNDDDA
eukprot:TRINITY_DN5354_c0_g1_i1.p1 TRINITY_DN5354_c0_g1~~TRINITY_DN5354_c0_g1_i1.p1  ORF type:complete len:859 (-),score=172.55 TRINITY_DN5354_c0_g1_i1:8-2533(-)